MATTTRLGIVKLEEAQDGKEITANVAFDAIDAGAALIDITNTDGYLDMLFSGTANPLSGMIGIKLNKNDKTSVNSMGVSLACEDTILWEGMALDYDTNNGSGSADCVLLYDSSVLQNEIQQVTGGTNTGGTFQLTWNGQQTSSLTLTTLTAAALQTAMEALSNIAPGDVSVVGNTGGPWLIEFTGIYAAEDQTLITMQSSLTGGSGHGVSVVYNGNINGNAGADVLRASRYADATGTSATKFQTGAPAGTARAQTEFWLFNAPRNLTAATFRFYDDNGVLNVFNFTNQSVTKKRCMVNWNNLWQSGTDYQNANTKEWSLVNSHRAAGSITRMYVSGDDALTNTAGVNTTNPLASWHMQGTNDSTYYDVLQTHLYGGYSTIANRSMLWQTILDASAVVNYQMLRGGLGAGSTRATPVLTSTFTTAHGIESTDTVMSLISAPSGTNQTISRVLSIGNNQMSVFGASVASKAGATDDLKDAWCGFGWQTNGGATPLDTDGGAITAGAILGTLFGGVTGPVNLNPLQVTFTTDANKTLTSTDVRATYIDIQTDAVLTTTRNLVVPLGIGNLWIVRNRNAQSIQIIGASGTGTTIASGKIAILIGSGANVIRVTQDQTP